MKDAQGLCIATTRKGDYIMAKRGLGRFVAFAAVAGAAAAGVSYVLRYKTFHKELEKDFREFEEDEEAEGQADQMEDQADSRKLNRSYISLNSSKDELKLAAKDMAQATRNVLKDAGSILSDTAHEAVSVAVDTAHLAIHTMKAKKEEFQENLDDNDDDDDIFEDEGFLDDDYVDDDDLYDYERMEGTPVYPASDAPAQKEAAPIPEEPVTIHLDSVEEDEEAAESPVIPARETALIEEDLIEP